MRDPMTWSLPLGRLFGVTLRVHIIFLLVIFGLIGHAAYQDKQQEGLWVEVTLIMFLLFFSVLLHELGHCFGARAVDGEAHEVMLWPLGGLAAVEVPQTPKAHFITAASGPAVNAFLCIIAVGVLATASVVPTFNPLEDPVHTTLYNWADGGTYGSKKGRGDLAKFTGFKRGDEWVAAPTGEAEGLTAVNLPPSEVVRGENNTWVLEKKDTPKVAVAETAMPVSVSFWLVQLSRLFWINWVLLLINMVPAFPLDGGRLLQSLMWWRTDHRAGTLAAVVVGFVLMMMVILLGIIVFNPLVLILAWFIFHSCRRQWILLETGSEDGALGYDFSQGYTSLEREGGQPPKKQPNFIQRWLQKRAALKAQKELEKREAEEKRMDELLEKVQKLGLQALTDEERRFLQRVSARFRNRQ